MAILNAITVFIVAFIAGVFSTAFVKWPPTQSSDWASWMQAVGSIVGIAIAIGVPAWQYAKAREQARLEAASGLRATVQVVRTGLDVVSKFVCALKRDGGRSYFDNEFQPGRFKHLQILMDSIIVHSLPTPTAVVAFIDARADFVACVNWVHSFNSEYANPTGRFDDFRDEFARDYAALVGDVDRLLNECNVLERGFESWSKGIAHIRDMS